MVELVYRQTQQARLVDRVLVATDDTRVKERVLAFGGDCVLTSPSHPSGTDRVAEVAAEMEFELVVNVQGDEPLVDPRAIDQAVAGCKASGGRYITSLRKVILSSEELWDPNVVKVVTDRRGLALYFSRWPIPFMASAMMGVRQIGHFGDKKILPPDGACYKHIGLYVYPKSLLLRLAAEEPSPLEQLERLEQLRALELGMRIQMEVTDYVNVAVDTPEDLERVRRMVEQSQQEAAGDENSNPGSSNRLCRETRRR